LEAAIETADDPQHKQANILDVWHGIIASSSVGIIIIHHTFW
jgi:hypothetical protein